MSFILRLSLLIASWFMRLSSSHTEFKFDLLKIGLKSDLMSLVLSMSSEVKSVDFSESLACLEALLWPRKMLIK